MTEKLNFKKNKHNMQAKQAPEGLWNITPQTTTGGKNQFDREKDEGNMKKCCFCLKFAFDYS